MTKLRVGFGVCVVGVAIGLSFWVAIALAQNGSGGDSREVVRMNPETMKWVDYPGDGAQFGIKQVNIYGDSSKPGLYIIRLTFPPGVMSLPHSHPDTRIGTVIKGTWWTGTGDKFDPASTVPVPTGGVMIHPAGVVHYDGARGEETIVQMMGIGPSGKTVARPGDPGFSKAQPSGAATPAPTRTVLQQVDVAMSPPQETIVATVDIAPGTGNALHTHNGSEIGYVVAGRIELEVQGQPNRQLGPGDSFLVTRGVPHRSILVGSQPAKLVNTWTVDKGKPLLTPVP